MLKKRPLIISIVVALLVVGAVIATQTSKPSNQPASSSTPNTLPEPTTATPEPVQTSQQSQTTQPTAEGRYVSYSEPNRSDASYNKTILFFHAPWCPQCRAFENNINANQVPAGTQILKTDYDSSTALKKQYGVTLQTTFVSVKPSGEQIKKWVGYTSDHTLKTLLSQF